MEPSGKIGSGVMHRRIRRIALSGCIGMALILHTAATAVIALERPRDGLEIRFLVKPGVENILRLRLTPEVAAKCVETLDLFPSFRAHLLAECDGTVVDIAEIPASGEIELYIPTAGRTPGRDMAVHLVPSTARTPGGEELRWGCDLIAVTGSEGYVQRFVLDVGYPTDSAYLGRRFSYQEGPSRRPEPWTRDRDYRWAEPEFTLRVPMLSDQPHEIRFVGHAPVGFRVLNDEQEIARFEQPQPETNSYMFAYTPRESDRGWLRMRVEPIAPFPMPNLDLRSLFFALERVEIQTLRPQPPAPLSLPGSSLLDIVFRATLPAAQISLEPRADWDSPAGFKTDVHLEQELAAAMLLGRAIPDPTGLDDSFTRTKRAHELIHTLDTAKSRELAEVAILIPARQRKAWVRRPGNNPGYMTSALGAFAMLSELRITASLISEPEIPASANSVRCIVLPNATWLTSEGWSRLADYVRSGGALVSTAHIAAFGSASRSMSTELFGAQPLEYHRYFFNIPFDTKAAYVPNADWQGMIAPQTAETLAPWVKARGESTDPPPPAIVSNRYGNGEAILLGYDAFDFYARFGAPAHRDLLAWILGRVLPEPALRVDGGETLSVSIRGNHDRVIIGLLNTSRGHFDYGGLMNSARPMIFVEDVPTTGPITLRYRPPGPVHDVRFVPEIDGATWAVVMNRLELRIPRVHVWAAVIIELGE